MDMSSEAFLDIQTSVSQSVVHGSPEIVLYETQLYVICTKSKFWDAAKESPIFLKADVFVIIIHIKEYCVKT